MSSTKSNTTGMPLTYAGELYEHSEAKVSLLQKYLRKYLAVTTNSDNIFEINIYDLFCGPGLYGSAEGSPLIILRALKEIHNDRSAAGKRVPTLNCYIADKDPRNIKSVETALSNLGLQSSPAYSVTILPNTYDQSMQDVLSRPYDPTKKQFVFLDPTGYGDVRVKHLQQILSNKAEILLFLPVQFMYRFISNGTPVSLKEFISDLTEYTNWTPSNSASALALEIRDLYRKFLGSHRYVSTFLIEKDSSTVFCLYFFTTNLLGYVKWIDAKWEFDGDWGSCYSFRNVPGQNSLVSGFHLELLERKLLDFLATKKRNNCEIFEFAVINEEFRSTHATKVCEKLVRDGRIQKRSLTGHPLPTSGFYINEKYYRNNECKIELEVV